MWRPSVSCLLLVLVCLPPAAAQAQPPDPVPSELAVLFQALARAADLVCRGLGERPRDYIEYRLRRLERKVTLLARYFTFEPDARPAAALEEYILEDIGAEIAEVDMMISGSRLEPLLGERWRMLVAVWRGFAESLDPETALDLESRARTFAFAVRSLAGGNAELGDRAEGFLAEVRLLVARTFLGAADDADRSARPSGLYAAAGRIGERLAGGTGYESLAAFWSGIEVLLERLEGRRLAGDRNAPPPALRDGPWLGDGVASNAPPVDMLERCDSQGVSGWAYDPDDPDQPLRVLVVVNGRVVRALTANRYSETIGGRVDIGNRYHGFAWDGLRLHQGRYTVAVYAVDLDDGSQHLVGEAVIEVESDNR